MTVGHVTIDSRVLVMSFCAVCYITMNGKAFGKEKALHWKRFLTMKNTRPIMISNTHQHKIFNYSFKTDGKAALLSFCVQKQVDGDGSGILKDYESGSMIRETMRVVQ